MATTSAAARQSYQADKATAAVYRDLLAAISEQLIDARAVGFGPVGAERVRLDVLTQERDRLRDLVREYEISAGQTAAQHPEVVAARVAPDKLSGCTCGGIGTSGAHSQGCPWR